MPWYLDPSLRVQPAVQPAPGRYRLLDRIEWRFARGERPPFGLTSADCPPAEEDLRTTFTLVVEEALDAVPDFARGPMEFSIVVSRAFRQLVEAMDPASHYYTPLRITLPDGRVFEGTHFLFRLGSFIDDGIVVEQSDVQPVVKNGKFMGRYLTTTMAPRLMWKASKVAGRHIWADKYLPFFHVVSDELYAEMQRRNMIDFITKESRIDPNT